MILERKIPRHRKPNLIRRKSLRKRRLKIIIIIEKHRKKSRKELMLIRRLK